MPRNRMSELEIAQTEHDTQDEAKRVKIVGTQINISTDENEDSMAVRPVLFQGTLILSEAIDVRKVRAGRIYVKVEEASVATVAVEISPDDSGDFFAEVAEIAVNAAAGACLVTSHIDLCARRLRVVVKNGTLVGSCKLVGQG